MAGYRLPQPLECPDAVYYVMTNCWLVCGRRPDFNEIVELLQRMQTKKLKKTAKRDTSSTVLVNTGAFQHAHSTASSFKEPSVHYYSKSRSVQSSRAPEYIVPVASSLPEVLVKSSGVSTADLEEDTGHGTARTSDLGKDVEAAPVYLKDALETNVWFILFYWSKATMISD